MNKQVSLGGVFGVGLIWLITIVVQGLLSIFLGLYILQNYLTHDNFLIWTANLPESAFGHMLTFIGLNIQMVTNTAIMLGVSVLVAFFKMVWEWDEKFTDSIRNFVLVFVAITLLLKMAGISCWWGGLFLAECVPMWAFFT